MIVIYGTASSGKSNIAEKMAVEVGTKYSASLVYMATMETFSESAKKRIIRHRKLREGKGFETIEEMKKPSLHREHVKNKVVLLECISNLCANVLFDELGDGTISDEDINRISSYIVDEIEVLSVEAKELIVVTNNLFEDGVIYDQWTEGYLKLLSRVNKKLAASSDVFIDVINGLPVAMKNNKREEI